MMPPSCNGCMPPKSDLPPQKPAFPPILQMRGCHLCDPSHSRMGGMHSCHLNPLRETLVNGQIHPSKSLIGAPVFFIKKKEGSLHLVQDYWKLNEIMVKNSYLLPLVSDVLTRLCNAKWFTTLDLHWGFNNV